MKKLVARYQARTDNLVVLGIGGSALGNIALQGALNPSTYNLMPHEQRKGPRIFVVDNVDPAYFGSVMDLVLRSDPTLDKTVFNVVSKSGETAETAAQFMFVRDLCKRILGKRFNEHIVAITDEHKGTMRKICDADGYPTLPVPDGVGGRFSVLSPVGLFSAGMCGIDIDALLEGAASMDAPCSKPALLENPAALLAFMLVELGTRKGKPIHVMMPYRNNLYLLADWYRQLWAESLGKQHDLQGNTVYAGFTPVKALGTTDQHSQVQLYREGPNDKVFCFVDVAPDPKRHDDLKIPSGLGVDALNYLEGKRMVDLLNAEKRATEYAMVESQRPNFTISMAKLDAHHVGGVHPVVGDGDGVRGRDAEHQHLRPARRRARQAGDLRPDGAPGVREVPDGGGEDAGADGARGDGGINLVISTDFPAPDLVGGGRLRFRMRRGRELGRGRPRRGRERPRVVLLAVPLDRQVRPEHGGEDRPDARVQQHRPPVMVQAQVIVPDVDKAGEGDEHHGDEPGARVLGNEGVGAVRNGLGSPLEVLEEPRGPHELGGQQGEARRRRPRSRRDRGAGRWGSTWPGW